MFLTVLAAGLFFVFGMPGTASAAIRYVAIGGADAGDCTNSGSPCESLEYILTGNRMDSGDTLIIGNGVYDAGVGGEGRIYKASGSANRIITDISGSGTVTIQPESPGGVTLQMPNGTVGGMFYTPSGGTIKFSDIDFDNPNSEAKPFVFVWSGGSLEAYDSSFDMNSAIAYIVQILDHASVGSTLFERTIFTNTNQRAVIRNDSASSVATIIFRACVAYNIAQFVSAPQASNLTLTNNILDGSTFGGIVVISNTGNIIDISNNIMIAGQFGSGTHIIAIALNDASSADIVANPGNYVIAHNAFWNYTIENAFQDSEGELQGIIDSTYLLNIDRSNIFVKPYFTDYAGHDYTMTPSSWVSGRGDNTKLPTADITGAAWTGNDIGAYANPSATARSVTINANKFAFVGDSIMNGSSAGAGSKAYEVFASLSSLSTDAGSVAVGGIQSQGVQWLADYVMTTYAPAHVFVSTGINNISNAVPTNWSISSLATVNLNILNRMSDWGATDVVWLGIPSIQGNPPDNTSVNTTNATVQASWSNYADLLSSMEVNSSWKTDYYASLTTDVHPNNAGHTLIAKLSYGAYTGYDVQIIDGSSQTYSYKPTVLLRVGGTSNQLNNFSSLAADVYENFTVNNTIFYDTVNLSAGVILTGNNSIFSQSEASVEASGGVVNCTNCYFSTDPLLINASSNNFILTQSSPAIDVGTDVGLSTDYAGNSLYGIPDIGAYEYQPPYTIGTHDIPTTGSIRVYTDGKYRMTTASTTSATTTFSITPLGGSYQATTTQYMDLTIDTWNISGNYEKAWTATSTAGNFLTQATSTVYTIGDLNPTGSYTFTVDGGAASTTAITNNSYCTNGVCTADSNGQVQFTYTGGYSTHTFGLTDATNPTLSLTEPANNSAANILPTFSWSGTDPGSGIASYSLYLDGTLVQTGASTSYTPTNALTCGSHTWYATATDNAANIAMSSTKSFTVACGGGGIFTGALPNQPTAVQPKIPTPTVVSPTASQLFKEKNSTSVYLIVNGTKHPIPNQNIFIANGFDWNDIIEVASLENYPSGDMLIYPQDYLFKDGSLLKGNDSKVFVLENNKRRWIASENVFTVLGYRWSMIHAVSETKLQSYTEGGNLQSTATHPDGTLFKYADSSKVYLLDNKKKRWITSEEVFNQRHLSWDMVLEISEMFMYEEGEDMA